MNKIKLFVVGLLVMIVCGIGVFSSFVANAADENPLLKEIAGYRNWTKVNSNRISLKLDASSLAG